MRNYNRDKLHSEGSNSHSYDPVQAVLHGVQGQRLGTVSKDPPRSDELLEYSHKFPQRGGNSEILQWMESTIIQTSNLKDKGLEQQKEGGKQGKSPSRFYQKGSSQQTFPRREEEQEKELEENIFPKLQDDKKPKRCHGQCLQHGQSLYGIQGQRGTKSETTSFPKETTFSPVVVNNLTEIKNSILTLKYIERAYYLYKK
ncbi:hypothetical protein O181_133026 [Austropuccinia psidii MF-1]|uniref:Uncharacterized protein n=1 Tax=Austropuccinia psidii MF-1 TaxID=1389203 RepID=A0A9Q3L6W6_9BASI|nr:hypothetical protein [Austropuccinia psidii MF-1]